MEPVTPVEAPVPDQPLLLTCAPAATFTIGDWAESGEPHDLSEPAAPSVPALVAAIEAVLPAEPPPTVALVAEAPVVRPRRRGGPPMAVLMERMAVS